MLLVWESIGAYVEAFESGSWTRGIVRHVADLIVYIELEGSEDLWRFSPDELRVSVEVRGSHL